MAGWLVAFALVLRAVASLSMPGTDAAAAIHAPAPVLSVHLNSNYDAATRRTGLTLPEGTIGAWCYGTATATGTSIPPSTRVITYSYDGLQRLTGAVESPGSSFAYAYDLAGNRTGVTVNGTQTISHTYDAADQVVGWTYDQAGNQTSDGTTTYSYDALNRTTAGTQINAYTYNGDGTLVGQTANGTTTSYTQDLAASQSQILAATTGLTGTDYLYGQDIAPLAALSGGIRTWYGIDAQGSVRQTLDDTGIVLGNQNYDPFGQVEAGSNLTSAFGYTGELQDAASGQEYLRARWYQPGSGTLLGVDPALGSTGQPYSYAGNDPVNGSDPSGQCTFPGGQLPGIEGAGSCDTAIQGSLVGAGGAVAGGILNNQSQFVAALNQALTLAQLSAAEEQSGAEAHVLNGAGCATPNTCANIADAAYTAALQTPGHVDGPTGVVSNGHVTGVLLGTETGTHSQISVGVFVLNGVVAVAVSVHAPGSAPSFPVTACRSGDTVAAGSLVPSLALGGSIGSIGGAAEAVGQGILDGEAVDRGFGGVYGILGAAVFGALIGVIAAELNPSLPPPGLDPCSVPRVVCFSLGARPAFAVPDVARHILAAQNSGKPAVLTYGGKPRRIANRGKACSEANKGRIGLPSPGLQCDEYPFATTWEGGAGASIAAVSKVDNGNQGLILNRFYEQTFHLIPSPSPNNPAFRFLVLVVP